MPPPTTAVYLNSTAPASPPGNQNVTFQSDGAQPEQSITAFPQLAVAGPGGAAGVVKPDGTSITQDVDGTIHAVVTGGTGGGGGGGTVSASGGFLVCVAPSGAKDGSNTQYTIPAPVLAGTGYFLVRNGVTQRELGTKAEYAVQGATITLATPLQSLDWIEFYYVMGTPNSESGGGGGTTPATGPVFIQGATGFAQANSVSSAFPSSNAAGNCLVVDAVGSNQGGTLHVSDSQGNTYISVINGSFGSTSTPEATWVALNCSAGPNTVTVTITGTPGGIPATVALAIHEYFGVASASAVDVSNYAVAPSTSSPFPVSLTTTVAGDLLHLYIGGIENSNWSGVAMGETGGWNARESLYPSQLGYYVGGIVTFDTVAAAPGSYSDTATISGHIWLGAVGYLIALKPI